MNYRLKDEVYSAKKAAMGEIYNLARESMKSGDRMVNFASGHPSTETFQDKMLKGYISSAMNMAGKDIFQYGSHAGYPPLRKVLTEFINTRGDIIKPTDDMIITYGATEAIYLTGQALINRGDRVIFELPSYVNAIKAFQIVGADIIGVHMEEDGVDLDELEKAMKTGAKVFYTVPNFSNPSGITMSLAKRKAVYDLAVKYQVPILEDNTYGELRYRGERLPNIKEFDREGAVIYVGSMSKIIAPALRIGFMAADKDFVKKVITVKAVSSNGVSSIMQHVLWKMLSENDIYSQIKKVCDINANKLSVAEGSMEMYFPESIRCSSPDGGMYIWVTLPDGSDAEEFCRMSSIRLHIPITPGNGFYAVEDKRCTSMRINFVKEDEEDTVYGLEKVGGLMKCCGY